ncbi:amino acid adenylation domain-containing protein [Kitasatospora sp. MAP12-15]|uniref:non-ribosomal peptide synthetase/type I polyketide synthase n=1 Tax=unclassified Kitasatospora TaxID=2633591 RepID=UPI0024741D55|nr:non-ribosomal peptide synthetase/type I polyketide synthase [Kitasatospora sp. MAP12-44]MDH6113664.1 amino acid adenylation domain-containing protein [Kitasatospora sp. MAP12-44]
MTDPTEDERQSVLLQSVKEIRRLRTELAAAEEARTEPIAIIGMACRMPGADEGPEGFWDLLSAGRDGTGDIPADRFDVERIYDPTGERPGTTRTRRGGFLSGIDQFDAAFFGVSPREAATLDPQQRLLMEVGWEALEHAGQGADQLAGTPTGVYLGVTNLDYPQRQIQEVDPAELESYYAWSNASTFAAGRMSYWLGLTGPSLSVDTACSSSLVGVHLACQSLRSGESSMALAGGVNVLLAPESFVVLSKTRALSTDGRCKTFDAAANGYARGEGCGIVVLKRLSDAVAHNDRILAVIRGTAVNQDGRSSGITVPNPTAQREVLHSALRDAGAAAAEIGYVEAHGTGTPLGDPIELRALASVYGGPERSEPLKVGSVKTNIGHLEPAAGVAGLIKVVLALQHEEIPPHLNLSEINPEIGIDELNVEIPTVRTPWPRQEQARLAGVSSFGASGTNAHVLVAEAPLRPEAEPQPDRTAHLLTLSAKTPAALGELTERYLDRLAQTPPEGLADLCYTAAVGRAHFAHRLAAVADSPTELAERLRDGDTATGQVQAGARPGAVFLFTGQGAQYPGMARTLYATEPAFRETLDRCDEVLRPLLDRSLLSLLDPAPQDAELIHQTRYTQPAMFAVEYALARLWQSWGIEPVAVLGHSVGELVAACVAGAIGLEDGLRLAARRGQLMQELCGPGAMAAVFAEPEPVRRALAPYAGELSLAAVNGPQSVVVSGDPTALAALLAELAEQGIRSKPIEVTRAFHSPLVEPMLDAFEQEAAGISYAAPRIPVVSNVTGQLLSGQDAFSAPYLREHVRRPVDFLAGMTTLFELGHRVFLEIGPAPTLLGMAKRFGPADCVFLPSLRPRQDDWQVALGSLAELYTRGFPVDWARLDATHPRRRVDLPLYPFQRSRHWYTPSERQPAALAPTAAAATAVPATLLGRRIPSPLDVVQYESRLSTETHRCLGDCVMDGLTVVNIGVYLESAFAATRELQGPGPFVVEDCLVLQSLVLDQDGSKNAQLLVEPSGAFQYHAQHQDEDGGTRWLPHARGRIRREPTLATAVAGTAQLEATRLALGEEVSSADFYRQMWQRKLYLGPSAQWIDRIWRREGEAIARMRTPEDGEAGPYLLHPGLTDATFQTLFACLAPDGPADAVYALVGIDRLEFHEYDPEQALYAHAVLLPATEPGKMLVAEVRLVDEQGRPVVLATGVVAKRAERDTVLRTGGAQTPARIAPAPTRTSAGQDGLAELRAASPAEREEQLRTILTRTIAKSLRAKPADLEVHEPLQNLGLDSLMALEVKDALSAELGVALPLVAFLEGNGIAKLAEIILGMLDLPQTVSAQAVSVVSPNTPATAGPRRTGLPVMEADPAARYEPFALTDLQQAYLVGRSNAFALGNVSTYFFIEVDLEVVDLPRLDDALQQLIARHDMMRAVVTPDGYQRVLPEVPRYVIRTTDLRGDDRERQALRLEEIHQEMKRQVLDAATWPMFDVRATLLDDRTTRLHIGLDALIMDAWSTSLLFREWSTVYRGEQLPELEVTFRDYVLAQRSMEGSELHQQSVDYWRARIPTLPAAPELPLAMDPAQLDRPEFAHRTGRLEEADWTRFKQFATAAGVTPSSALCTVYSQVLAAWSKSDRFTLNVLFFNRLPMHKDVSELVGNFTATTLLEIDSTATDAFAVRADRIQKQLWSDLEHSHVSGVQVLRELARARGGSGRMTMPVVFASTVNFGVKENASTNGFAAHLMSMGESGQEVWSSIRTPQVWLDHQAIEDNGALVVNWDVVEEIFPAGMIDAMFAAYLDVLRGLCSEEQAWHRPSPVLVPDADLARRQELNATAAPLPGGLLHDAFVAHAAATPERTAVIAPERTLSYGELDGLANQVDRLLRRHDVAPGALVGVVMEKGWEQVAAVLAVLKSGAAYVPIDAAVPAERLRVLLDTARISTVLTQQRVAERAVWPSGIAVLAVDGEDAAAQSTEPLAIPATLPTDLAYVIFTSGSTGVPKGVMIEHRAALNTVLDVNERFGVTEQDRTLALSALNFDLSVYDVFGLLAAGGALVLPEPGAHREPARWASLVREHGVTVWNSVPTLMEMLAEHVLAEDVLAEDAGASPPLRVVMMSGDWIPVTLPERIRAAAPGAAIWSLGGATEAAIWSICYPIGEVPPEWTSIPYGAPLRSQQFHVLNDAMQPCPVWVPGQLYIAGAGVARGYLGDEAKTRASFVRHPSTGERLYRTGDLGRYLPDGNIEFLGREDFQVKVRGYRIELGEIEAALLQCPGVRAAVATAVGADQSAKRLIGYVVLDGEPADGEASADAEAELLRTLHKVLPEYLVPQRILLLDALPLSSNGKVDRSALPSPEDGVGDGREVLPRDEIEQLLADTWGDFFGRGPLGVGANFFDLGGDSLTAVRMMAEVKRRLGRDLPLSVLFARPTIELLAQALRDGAALSMRTALVPIRPEGTQSPLFFIHPVGGDVLCYAELAGQLGDDQPFYGLQVPDLAEPLTTVPQLAEHYAAAIEAAAPDGPLRLGGWSMGGVIALELAGRLSDAGREVELVAAIDLLEAPNPTATEPVADADLLCWFARDLAGQRDCDWTPQPQDYRPTDGRSPIEVLHGDACRTGALPPGIDLATLTRIVDRFTVNSRALLAHQAQPYGGRVTLVRAEDGSTRETSERWLALCGPQSELIELPGDHYSVMRTPRLSALAAGLRAALDPAPATP